MTLKCIFILMAYIYIYFKCIIILVLLMMEKIHHRRKTF
jgi:hypothetical protein